MIHMKDISDHLLNFKAPSWHTVQQLKLDNPQTNVFSQVFSFTTIKKPKNKLTDFLVISTESIEEEQLSMVIIMGMTLTGVLEILYTAICDRSRNFNSISETLSNFKKAGFTEPKSILCDDKIVIEAARSVFKSKGIQYTLCLQTYLLRLDESKIIKQIAPLFNKSNPDDVVKGPKGIFET